MLGKLSKQTKGWMFYALLDSIFWSTNVNFKKEIL